MIDKITAKIRRYPFQTGIIVGILICLLCVGFFSLFEDHGKTLAGNDEIIQQDYLRMTINEYSRNNDELLADWRYKHLGNKSAETLKLMTGDESIPAQQVVSFAKAIGQADKLGQTGSTQINNTGTPANPRKGLSGFGKVLLIILGLVVVAAGGLYAASLLKTKIRQKRRTETPTSADDPINMITPEKTQTSKETAPDTLFDLDSLFPQGGVQPEQEITREDPELTEDSREDKPDANMEFDSSGILFHELDVMKDSEETEKPEQDKAELHEETEISSEPDESESAPAETENQIDQMNGQIDNLETDAEQQSGSDLDDDLDNLQPGLNFENSIHDFDRDKNNIESDSENKADSGIDQPGQDTEVSSAEYFGKAAAEENIGNEVDVNHKKNDVSEFKNDDTEKPLIETDSEAETENEDELLKMIRESSSNQNAELKSAESEESETAKDPEQDKISGDEPEIREISQSEQTAADQPENPEKNEESTDDILIHYQSVYRIGNDMYDEVFSIDQGDIFRGECGISIGETLNNTEPKAVTAFEVWLFDKDDIHTATWYLMSDFALDNEGISKRLEQRGKCDLIRKHDVYTLETETLTVEIKVLELEYGTEMEEKNSYFTNVVFDIIARQKMMKDNEN